jgi:hypothetical protein
MEVPEQTLFGLNVKLAVGKLLIRAVLVYMSKQPDTS